MRIEPSESARVTPWVAWPSNWSRVKSGAISLGLSSQQTAVATAIPTPPPISTLIRALGGGDRVASSPKHSSFFM